MQREQIQSGDARHIDDGSNAAVAQNGCAHQAVNSVKIPFQALDDHLLLTQKLIDHQPHLAAAGFDNHRKPVVGILRGLRLRPCRSLC